MSHPKVVATSKHQGPSIGFGRTVAMLQGLEPPSGLFDPLGAGDRLGGVPVCEGRLRVPLQMPASRNDFLGKPGFARQIPPFLVRIDIIPCHRRPSKKAGAGGLGSRTYQRGPRARRSFPAPGTSSSPGLRLVKWANSPLGKWAGPSTYLTYPKERNSLFCGLLTFWQSFVPDIHSPPQVVGESSKCVLLKSEMGHACRRSS